MFTDRIQVKLTAGRGGNGVIAWRREKHIPKGGPQGGNGGRGGSIILESDGQIRSLDAFRNRKNISAENGQQGGSQNKQGRRGKDLTLKVPCGTLVKDVENETILYDFTLHQEEFHICEGGKGGQGNVFFKTATHQAPAKCTRGQPGKSRIIELELKLIADVGFLGFPNGGKSTLFSKLSAVQVKTAPYPFTTLTPQLSFVEFDDFSRVYLADIPGIIKNAHQNRGLGLFFLKHIERCSTLIYLIDISGIDGRDPYEDFLTLRQEIQAYSPAILNKPFLVALNKIDADNTEDNLRDFKEKYSLDNKTLFEISALHGHGLTPLVEEMRQLAQAKGKNYH